MDKKEKILKIFLIGILLFLTVSSFIIMKHALNILNIGNTFGRVMPTLPWVVAISIFLMGLDIIFSKTESIIDKKIKNKKKGVEKYE